MKIRLKELEYLKNTFNFFTFMFKNGLMKNNYFTLYFKVKFEVCPKAYILSSYLIHLQNLRCKRTNWNFPDFSLKTKEIQN